MLQLLHDGCLCCINGSLIDSERNVLDTLVGYGSDRTAIQVYCCQGLRKQMSKKSGYLNSSYLQNIVDICCLEKQINRFIALNFLLSFKETHAMLKQHHLAQREGHSALDQFLRKLFCLLDHFAVRRIAFSQLVDKVLRGRNSSASRVLFRSSFLFEPLKAFSFFFVRTSCSPHLKGRRSTWLLSLSMAKRTS